MSKLFQIYEQDLADLEQILPQLADRLARPDMTNKDRTNIRRAQSILSNVRWNYGPPSSVEEVPG